MKRILKFCTAVLTALCMTAHASAAGDDGLLIREGCLLSVSGETTACGIPDGVREIADDAFAGAVNLEYIVIPASVEKVPEDFLCTLPEGTEVYYMGTWSSWSEISDAGRYASDLYTADLILRIAALPILNRAQDGVLADGFHYRLLIFAIELGVGLGLALFQITKQKRPVFNIKKILLTVAIFVGMFAISLPHWVPQAVFG